MIRELVAALKRLKTYFVTCHAATVHSDIEAHMHSPLKLFTCYNTLLGRTSSLLCGSFQALTRKTPR